MLNLLLCAVLAAGAPGGKLTVKTGNLAVTLEASAGWTIRSVDFQGDRLIIPAGGQGAVILSKAGTWLGSTMNPKQPEPVATLTARADGNAVKPTGAIEAKTRGIGACACLVKYWAVGLFVMAPVVGFLASYVLTAQTIIYFLMRKAVDGTDMTEVFVEEEEEDYSIPPTPSPEAEAKEASAAEEAEAGEKEEEEEEAAAPAKKKAKKTTRKKTTRKKATRKKKST